MAGIFAAGNNAKVTLGATVVNGMGNWKMTGITVDLLETTAFGDSAKQFMTGLVDYGGATFGGLYDVSNAGAQSSLLSHMLNNAKVSDLRLYVNSVSFWVANKTADSASGCYVTSITIGQDKSGLATLEATVKYTGPVVFQ